MMGRLKVTQTRSEIGGKQNQRDTLRSLGLKRIGDVVVKEDRPEIRGMVATVPHHRPLPARDWLRYARLCLALRHPGLHYPNDRLLRAPADLLDAHGLDLVVDELDGFACPLQDGTAADALLRSLYLPDVDQRRMLAGQRVVQGWVGTGITVPLRRLVARRR